MNTLTRRLPLSRMLLCATSPPYPPCASTRSRTAPVARKMPLHPNETPELRWPDQQMGRDSHEVPAPWSPPLPSAKARTVQHARQWARISACLSDPAATARAMALGGGRRRTFRILMFNLKYGVKYLRRRLAAVRNRRFQRATSNQMVRRGYYYEANGAACWVKPACRKG